MNPVSAGPPTGDHDSIARPGLLGNPISRDQPDAAAEDQRIGQVALIEVNRSVDRGNPHAVAVVAHSANHAFEHPPRMKHVPGQTPGARQNTSVEAIGLAPRPQPIMSRMQPPMPVAAPP